MFFCLCNRVLAVVKATKSNDLVPVRILTAAEAVNQVMAMFIFL